MSVIIDETAIGMDESLGKLSVEPVSATRGMHSQRIYYLDNLRAMAMLLGVFLHSALAYAQPAQSVWLATDSNASVPLDASIWFIHLFRMGLFFLLSGYFAKLVIERKTSHSGAAYTIFNRGDHLLLSETARNNR